MGSLAAAPSQEAGEEDEAEAAEDDDEQPQGEEEEDEEEEEEEEDEEEGEEEVEEEEGGGRVAEEGKEADGTCAKAGASGGGGGAGGAGHPGSAGGGGTRVRRTKLEVSAERDAQRLELVAMDAMQRAVAARREPLGVDRHGNRYWALAGSGCPGPAAGGSARALYVEYCGQGLTPPSAPAGVPLTAADEGAAESEPLPPAAPGDGDIGPRRLVDARAISWGRILLAEPPMQHLLRYLDPCGADEGPLRKALSQLVDHDRVIAAREAAAASTAAAAAATSSFAHPAAGDAEVATASAEAAAGEAAAGEPAAAEPGRGWQHISALHAGDQCEAGEEAAAQQLRELREELQAAEGSLARDPDVLDKARGSSARRAEWRRMVARAGTVRQLAASLLLLEGMVSAGRLAAGWRAYEPPATALPTAEVSEPGPATGYVRFRLRALRASVLPPSRQLRAHKAPATRAEADVGSRAREGRSAKKARKV